MEVVIYLGVLTLLLTSAIGVMQSTSEGQASATSAIDTQQEGSFIVSKLEWLARTATSVQVDGSSITFSMPGNVQRAYVDDATSELMLDDGTQTEPLSTMRASAFTAAMLSVAGHRNLRVTFMLGAEAFVLNVPV